MTTASKNVNNIIASGRRCKAVFIPSEKGNSRVFSTMERELDTFFFWGAETYCRGSMNIRENDTVLVLRFVFVIGNKFFHDKR